MTTTDARRGPGRPRRRPAEVDRQRILQAARRAFAERGFDGAAIEAIAASAEVTRPAVYEMFGSKEGLVTAVVDDAEELLVARLAGAFVAPPGVAWQDVVRASFVATFDVVREHADAFTVLLLAEGSGGAGGMANARRRAIAALADGGREQWRRVGVEVGTAAEVIALMTFAMGEAVARRQLSDGLDEAALVELLTVFTTGGLMALAERDFVDLLRLDG